MSWDASWPRSIARTCADSRTAPLDEPLGVAQRGDLVVGEQRGRVGRTELGPEPLEIDEQGAEGVLAARSDKVLGEVNEEIAVVRARREAARTHRRIRGDEAPVQRREVARVPPNIIVLQVVQAEPTLVVPAEERAIDKAIQEILGRVTVDSLGLPQRPEHRLRHRRVLREDGEIEVPQPLGRVERVEAHRDRAEQIGIRVLREALPERREIRAPELVQGVVPAIGAAPDVRAVVREGDPAAWPPGQRAERRLQRERRIRGRIGRRSPPGGLCAGSGLQRLPERADRLQGPIEARGRRARRRLREPGVKARGQAGAGAPQRARAGRLGQTLEHPLQERKDLQREALRLPVGLADEQGVGDQPERIDIRGGPEPVDALDLLGRHVKRRPREAGTSASTTRTR